MNRTHSHRNLLWSGHWPVVFHKRTGTLLYSLFVSWSFYWQSNGRVEGFTMCILSDAYELLPVRHLLDSLRPPYNEGSDAYEHGIPTGRQLH